MDFRLPKTIDKLLSIYRVGQKKAGQQTHVMTIILSNLNRCNKDSLKDSWVNLQLN